MLGVVRLRSRAPRVKGRDDGLEEEVNSPF